MWLWTNWSPLLVTGRWTQPAPVLSSRVSHAVGWRFHAREGHSEGVRGDDPEAVQEVAAPNEYTGVWVSNEPLDINEGAAGDVLLSVPYLPAGLETLPGGTQPSVDSGVLARCDPPG